MPLPKKSEVDSKKECISKTYKVERKTGKSHEQAQAIALSHCGKLFGDNKMELLGEIKHMLDEINETKKEWQKEDYEKV